MNRRQRKQFMKALSMSVFLVLLFLFLFFFKYISMIIGCMTLILVMFYVAMTIK